MRATAFTPLRAKALILACAMWRPWWKFLSMAHGWGNQRTSGMRVAQEHAGVNSNVLSDERLFDPISGNAVLNGIPVTISRVG